MLLTSKTVSLLTHNNSKSKSKSCRLSSRPSSKKTLKKSRSYYSQPSHCIIHRHNSSLTATADKKPQNFPHCPSLAHLTYPRSVLIQMHSHSLQTQSTTNTNHTPTSSLCPHFSKHLLSHQSTPHLLRNKLPRSPKLILHRLPVTYPTNTSTTQTPSSKPNTN